MSGSSAVVPDRLAVVVWLDHWHAFVARNSHGHNAVIEVARDVDPEGAYLRRVAMVACDCPRVMILGPDDDRLAFDREYESMYERPDRFVEVEALPWPTSAGLLDRLRMLEDEQPWFSPAAEQHSAEDPAPASL